MSLLFLCHFFLPCGHMYSNDKYLHMYVLSMMIEREGVQAGGGVSALRYEHASPTFLCQTFQRFSRNLCHLGFFKAVIHMRLFACFACFFCQQRGKKNFYHIIFVLLLTLSSDRNFLCPEIIQHEEVSLENELKTFARTSKS